MKTAVIWLLLILLVLGGVLHWWPTKTVTIPNIATTTPALVAPVLSPALYPLYNAVSWGTTTPEHFIIGTTSYSGTKLTSSIVVNTMDPGKVFTAFEKYYDQKLKALGWTIANDLAAGGHVGGQTGYRKDGEVLLTRFSILYHTVSSTSPSECPCDVTLSLFSSGK